MMSKIPQKWVLTFFVSTFFIMIAVWVFLLAPTIQAGDKNIQEIIAQKKELQALRDLKNQITMLENKMLVDDKSTQSAPKETLLKQMETVAQETKVFSKISRVTPTTFRKNGQDSQALNVELEQISLYQLTPFMHALSHQSLLEIESINMRKSTKGDGIIEARLTLTQI